MEYVINFVILIVDFVDFIYSIIIIIKVVMFAVLMEDYYEEDFILPLNIRIHQDRNISILLLIM